jgi:type I restriction enzyme M protein
MTTPATRDQSHLKWIADFIWNIADDRLRDVYVRGKYRDVILPFIVLRRMDAVLEYAKHKVLERKRFLDKNNVAEQDGALRMAAGQAFYNVSEFTLAKLKASSQGQRLREDFIAYLDGFSPNVQEILTKFKFRDQIQTLVDAHVLGYLIEDFLDPEVNLSPMPVKDADGRIKLPALDNHGMGTVFEELIRRFNEENNEEAGEHFTPRDVVKLMAKLMFMPVADQIQSGTYLLYDGACGTGGMLTVAEETLQELAEEHGKEVSIHAIQRGLTGYLVELLANVVRSSNGLYTMAGMLLAILSGDEALAKRMSKIQPRFADCLPPLIAPVARPET